jgi:hypothetical protein
MMDTLNRLRPNRCTAIGQFISVHARNDDMAKVHQAQALRNAAWLVVVKRSGATRLDIAEPARTSACIAEDHDGCGASAPTLTHVWATCFLANSVQAMLIDDLPEARVPVAAGHSRSQPIGLAPQVELMRRFAQLLSQNAVGQTEDRCAGRALGVAAKRSGMSSKGSLHGVSLL